jgi:hypothetical protein
LPQFQYDNEYIEAIALTKYIPDMVDLLGISVSLLECGTRFLVQEPSISRFMSTNYAECIAGFADNVYVHETLVNMHEMLLATLLVEDNTRRTKRYILKLPAGIKCKMGYNNPINRQQLSGNLNYATTTLGTALTNLSADIECIHPSITFLVVMDKEP